jgi:hypothetical protein
LASVAAAWAVPSPRVITASLDGTPKVKVPAVSRKRAELSALVPTRFPVMPANVKTAPGENTREPPLKLPILPAGVPVFPMLMIHPGLIYSS